MSGSGIFKDSADFPILCFDKQIDKKDRGSLFQRTIYHIWNPVFYSLVNMLVIVQNFRDGQKSYLSAVNMGCIVLADLYLLYYVKMADEKKHYENRVKALEQQAKCSMSIIWHRLKI